MRTGRPTTESGTIQRASTSLRRLWSDRWYRLSAWGQKAEPDTLLGERSEGKWPFPHKAEADRVISLVGKLCGRGGSSPHT